MAPSDVTQMQLLFSYGTLQFKQVQIRTFGRELIGRDDVLSGYCLDSVKIEDPDVVDASGKSVHPIIRYTGAESDRVNGRILSLTDQELKHADAYEVDAYKRIHVTLVSGKTAWAFVEA